MRKLSWKIITCLWISPRLPRAKKLILQCLKNRTKLSNFLGDQKCNHWSESFRSHTPMAALPVQDNSSMVCEELHKNSAFFCGQNGSRYWRGARACAHWTLLLCILAAWSSPGNGSEQEDVTVQECRSQPSWAKNAEFWLQLEPLMEANSITAQLQGLSTDKVLLW